jgi:uncharacterized protein with PIN domain
MSKIVKRLPRLLADAMLGRLAKWLRLLGYDTFYAENLSDHQIVARARAEGRVVLTRDREMARRKGIHCLSIQSDLLEEQIREVALAFGMPSPEVQPRCALCNASLIDVSADQARSHVPMYVWQTHRVFRYCPHCDKYYWAGSQWQKIQSVIGRALGRCGDDRTNIESI